jgi:hypothetical protein
MDCVIDSASNHSMEKRPVERATRVGRARNSNTESLIFVPERRLRSLCPQQAGGYNHFTSRIAKPDWMIPAPGVSYAALRKVGSLHRIL